MTRINQLTLRFFASILIFVGIYGFFQTTPTTTAYNLFHIFFGMIGAMILFSRNQNWMIGFNIGFGLIDIYQAIASHYHLFPEKYFQWKPMDDTLHVVIGTLLVVIGIGGCIRRQASKQSKEIR